MVSTESIAARGTGTAAIEGKDRGELNYTFISEIKEVLSTIRKRYKRMNSSDQRAAFL